MKRNAPPTTFNSIICQQLEAIFTEQSAVESITMEIGQAIAFKTAFRVFTSCVLVARIAMTLVEI